MNITTHAESVVSPACYYVFQQNHITIEDNTVLVTLLLFMFFFIVTTNVLLMYGVRVTTKTKKLSRTKRLFLYLSGIDLFTGLVTIPYQISMIALGKNASCFQVGLQAFLNALTPILAMFTIFTMSVLRYMSIKNPMLVIGSRRLLRWSLLQFFLVICLTVFYVISSQFPGSLKLMGTFMMIVTILCIGLVITIGILNAVLYFSLASGFNRQSVIRIGNFTSSSAKRHILNQRKATETLLLISCALVICYCPNGIIFGVISLNMLTGKHQKSYATYSPWAHLPMLLNAGLDSFIYIVRKEKICKHYKRLLKRARDHFLNHTEKTTTKELETESMTGPSDKR